MFANCFNIAAKQFCHLMTIKPNCFVFKTDVKLDHFIRLINDYLVFHTVNSN